MKIILSIVTTCFAMLLLSSCQHTAEGLNQDIQHNTKVIRKEINS